MRCGTLLASVFVLGTCHAAVAEDAPSAPAIEPEAERLLKHMCDNLASLDQFMFKAQDTHEVVLESGEKIQLTNNRVVVVRRPDRLACEFDGDTASSNVYYNGTTLTLVDLEQLVYGTVEVPGTIDQMIDYAVNTYGVELPLADLLYADPYKALTAGVKSGMYLGRHLVGEDSCHHLAFVGEQADWQIWISDDEKAYPRKLAITYKNQKGTPEYEAVMLKWIRRYTLQDSLFSYTPPENVQKIDMLPIPGHSGDGEKKVTGDASP